MNASNRNFRGRNVHHLDHRGFDQPENIGNRKTFDEVRIPPDNVGNQAGGDIVANFVHDSLGNSLDDEPAHLRSGLCNFSTRERKLSRNERATFDTNQQYDNRRRMVPRRINEPKEESKPLRAVLNGDEYIEQLSNEFKKVLKDRTGIPFAFSMKPLSDAAVDDSQELEHLSSIENFLEDVLANANIEAMVSFSQYRTMQHHFAVFFVNPTEKDPNKNKDLISALRHVVKLHAQRFSPGQVNVLLVLANAQGVIEAHLTKIGAVKIGDD